MQESDVLDEATGEPVMDPKTGKPKKRQERMKTRSGDIVKLADLLNEAQSRAKKIFEDRMARQAEQQAENGSAQA